MPADAAVDFNNVNWKYFERQVRSGDVVLTPGDLAAMQQLYDGEIRCTDHEIGRLFDLLRRQGRYENTIIVITADHGEEFMEHGNIGHGNSLYEEVLAVPLIVRAPGVGARRVRDLVQLVDVMPTILDLASLAAPAEIGGRSLRPLLRGSSLSPRPAFADHRPDGARGCLIQSVRDGKYKLIRTYRKSVDDKADDQPWNPPDIQPGDWLEFEGMMQDDGHLLALEIEPQEVMGEIRIAGQVTDLAVDKANFRVLNAPCRLVQGARFKTEDDVRVTSDRLTEGSWVQVKGPWSEDGPFQVRRVKFLEDTKREVKAPVLEVERTPGGMLIHLTGFFVDVDDETEFDGEWPGWEPEPTVSKAAEDDTAGEAIERVLKSLQLFDLDVDPGEVDDIGERRPDLVERLTELLDGWEHAYEGDIVAPQIELDEEAMEKLRSLGYVQ